MLEWEESFALGDTAGFPMPKRMLLCRQTPPGRQTRDPRIRPCSSSSADLPETRTAAEEMVRSLRLTLSGKSGIPLLLHGSNRES